MPERGRTRARRRAKDKPCVQALGHDLHSNYGPTADTGGLMQNHAPTIYAYASIEALLEGESHGGTTSPLMHAAEPRKVALTERPGR